MKSDIKNFCERHGLTEDQFFGREKIGGGLDLGSLTSLPDGFAPTLGGDLDLGSLTSLPDGFAPTVGGSLYLGSLTSLPDGFAPTVGGGLDLRSLTSLPDGFAPTVGGNLYLPHGMTARKKTPPPVLSWQKGRYISCDGIFTEVIKKRGNVRHVKKIGDIKESYLVTDGAGKFAHGATLAEAKADLGFKISRRDKSAFSSLTRKSRLKMEEAIECYRVITGACAAGVRDFIAGITPKKSYTIAEICTLTKDRFGHEEFTKFFQK